MTSSEGGEQAIAMVMLMLLQNVQEWRERGEHQRVLDLAQSILDRNEVESFGAADPMLAALAALAANAFASAQAVGQMRLALAYAEREMAFAKQDGGDYSRARALNNHGLAKHELGELAAAENDYLAALAIIERTTDDRVKSLRSALTNNLGLLRLTRGEHDSGLQDLSQSVTLPSPEAATAGAPNEVVQLNNRAFVAFNTGDFETAETTWKQALAAMSSYPESAAMRGIIVCNLAELYNRTSRQSQAIEYYTEAIRIHSGNQGSQIALATDYNNLGIVYQQTADAEKAIECFKQAWDSVREVSPRSLVALSALKGIGLHRLLQRDFKRARTALKRGMDLYEEMRPSIAVTEPGHAGFLETYRQLLEIAMYLSLDQSWPDELLEHIERAKARFLRERIAAHEPDASRGNFEKANHGHRDLTGFNALVLNYFVGPNATFLSYGYNRSLGAARIDLGEKELSALVQSFRDDLMSSSRRAGQGEVAQTLSRALFEKVHLQSGRVRYIHVMPDGPLYYLPFEALPAPEWLASQNDRPRLGTVTPLSYAPSLSALAALRDRNKELADRSEWRFLVVGEPETSDDFAQLDGATVELENLTRLASDRVEINLLRGKEATRENFLSLLPAASHVHIASHAVADLDDENPYVLFSGVGADRFLRTQELQNIQMNAQLVFLSACSTSVGRSSTGEGLMSMARAFLWAGCRCVVATLWPVDDHAAPEFVRLFYAGLLNNLSVAQAARAAREQFRTANGGARTWAAFQVFGDADMWEDRYSLEHIDYFKESA